jgi:rod shape-determining protein MreC
LRQYLLIIIIILALVVVLFSLRIPGLRPVQSLLEQPLAFFLIPFNEPGQKISNIWRGLDEAADLRDENEKLRTQVGVLTEEIVRLQESARENQYLKEQLWLQQQDPAYQRTQARVVGKDPNPLVKAIIVVPLGSEPLLDGMTAVTASGLIGRIIRTNPRSSTILLITDSSSAVTAITQKTRARGVLVGQSQNNGPLLFRNVSQGDQIEKGDLVLTAGVGGIFPEGIVIGRIRDVIKRDVDATQQAIVESPVDFDTLERVLLITSYSPVKLD